MVRLNELTSPLKVGDLVDVVNFDALSLASLIVVRHENAETILEDVTIVLSEVTPTPFSGQPEKDQVGRFFLPRSDICLVRGFSLFRKSNLWLWKNWAPREKP